jgi:hypothetical protein
VTMPAVTMPFKRDGRRKLFYLVGAGCLIMAALFFTYGYEKTWRLWNIPVMMPYLADARVITAGAESHALGYDPLISNPRDPWGRPMNYTRVWQFLFYLGLDQSDTIYFGVIFAALFFSAVFLITKHIDQSTAWLMTCAIFSPAVLLGLERGNTDLLVFFLLALAVYAIKKSRVGTTVVIGLLFLLKLYPIFALAIFLREHKRVFRAIMVSSMIIVCGIYTMIMFDELRLIRLATPRPTSLAYGLDVAWMRAVAERPHAAIALRILSYAAVLLILAHVAAGPLVNVLLDLACKWIIFSGLLYLFVYSWPDWLKSYLPYVKATPTVPVSL